jgi:hypothetical protein
MTYILMKCLVWCPGQNKSIASLPLFHGCRKGFIALTPEIEYNQTAMGLPLVMSVVFFIAK